MAGTCFLKLYLEAFQQPWKAVYRALQRYYEVDLN